MLPGYADRVFNVLRDVCGAHESDRASFVHEFEDKSNYGPTSEYRFQGHFGFGGKFRYPRFSVDGYPEDMKARPALEHTQVTANNELAEIKREMMEAGWTEY
jgi:hypothetical protein